MRRFLQVFRLTFMNLFVIVGFTVLLGVILIPTLSMTPYTLWGISVVVTIVVLTFKNISRLEEIESRDLRFDTYIMAVDLCHEVGGDKLAQGVQKHVEKRLISSAQAVKWAADNLIILQKGGLEAVIKRGVGLQTRVIPEDEDGLEAARREVRLRLTEEFTKAQESFYRRYDTYLEIQKYYHQFRLRERSWKAYLDEEPVNKTA